jgi:hypothetical protein
MAGSRRANEMRARPTALFDSARDNLFYFLLFFGCWGRTFVFFFLFSLSLLNRSGRPCLAAISWGFSCFFFYIFIGP